MYMFLPFLVALAAAVGAFAEYRKFVYLLWAVTLAVTAFWFRHHATSALHLSF